MDQERWQQVDALFQEALQLDPSARIDALREWCQNDLELFEEVQAMLFYDDKPTHFLIESLRDRAIEIIAKTEEHRLPEIMGGYRVEKLLAHGGMGSVYIAKQLEPVERTVAIKVLNTREEDFLQRFDYERQVLALLTHPHVAQVYDAGLTVEGYHYFTMEYVEGEDLLSYCDDHLLSLEARLNLFVLVCDGVSHAHRRGVIHRDLKPSNILVNTDEEKPIPKIIDFGIAQKVTESTISTTGAWGFGTPAYMSPECFHGDQTDTTADIYALGVVLYQLLCGRLPFDEEVYKDRQQLSELLERHPLPLPSQNIPGDRLAEVARLRQLAPNRLVGKLKGDLDAIVAKCMRPSPRDRYLSVEALVEDIQAYLDGDVVGAHPPGFLYKVAKLVTRDKRMTLAISSLLIASILLIAFLYLHNEGLKNRRRTEIMRTMIDKMLKSTNPRHDRKDYIGSFFLEAEKQIEEKMENDKDKAQMFTSLGESLAAWRQFDEAISKFDRAIAISEGKPGMENEWRQAKLERAYAMVQNNAPEKAIDDLYGLLRWAELRGSSSTDAIKVRRGIADALKNSKKKEAAAVEYEKLLRDCHDNSPDCLAGKINYANLLLNSDPKKAYQLFSEVYNLRKSSAVSDSDTYSAAHGVGWALIKLGRFDEAKPYVIESFKNRENIFGDNIDTFASYHNYILVRNKLGELSVDEVVGLYLDLSERKLALFGYNLHTLPTLINLADAYNKAGESGRALLVIKRIRDHYEKSAIPIDKLNAIDINELEALILEGRREDAQRLLQNLQSRSLERYEQDALEKCRQDLARKTRMAGRTR